MPDKFTATWVSHSSMSDFIKCPRAYYLRNVYKDPQTGHKIQLMSPPLALGGAVHQVIENLSTIPTPQRFKKSLIESFAEVWKQYTGKKGGFSSSDQEQLYRQRGETMLRRVMNHPGPLAGLAVKIKEPTPYYWLSEADNIILCGKIDWLQYLPEEDAVHIIDFKTSKQAEKSTSLQLPIYHLLVHNTQQRRVAKVSYWYLEFNDEPTVQKLPDLEAAHEQILTIAKQMRLARKLERFKCPQGEGGCYACQPMEKILRGEAELVGTSEFNQDVYIIPSLVETQALESELL